MSAQQEPLSDQELTVINDIQNLSLGSSVNGLPAAYLAGKAAGRASAEVERVDRPRIICLCGSTRFIEQFAILTWELEREGNIVLGCTLLPAWYCDVPSHFGERTGTKEQCDALHLRKIDLADEVLVLNIGGYIGESTQREIQHATRTGKPVRYMEAIDASLALDATRAEK